MQSIIFALIQKKPTTNQLLFQSAVYHTQIPTKVD